MLSDCKDVPGIDTYPASSKDFSKSIDCQKDSKGNYISANLILALNAFDAGDKSKKVAVCKKAHKNLLNSKSRTVASMLYATKDIYERYNEICGKDSVKNQFGTEIKGSKGKGCHQHRY